jgi:hypothetical protein
VGAIAMSMVYSIGDLIQGRNSGMYRADIQENVTHHSGVARARDIQRARPV